MLPIFKIEGANALSKKLQNVFSITEMDNTSKTEQISI